MELTYFPNILHRQLESQMEAWQHGLGCPQKMDGSWKDKNFIQVNDCQALTAGVPFAQSHHVCPVQTLEFISSPNTTACLRTFQKPELVKYYCANAKILIWF